MTLNHPNFHAVSQYAVLGRHLDYLLLRQVYGYGYGWAFDLVQLKRLLFVFEVVVEFEFVAVHVVMLMEYLRVPF